MKTSFTKIEILVTSSGFNIKAITYRPMASRTKGLFHSFFCACQNVTGKQKHGTLYESWKECFCPPVCLRLWMSRGLTKGGQPGKGGGGRQGWEGAIGKKGKKGLGRGCRAQGEGGEAKREEGRQEKVTSRGNNRSRSSCSSLLTSSHLTYMFPWFLR